MSDALAEDESKVHRRPPIDPETAREWHKRLQWWEGQTGGTLAINPTDQELTRAQELLEKIVKSFPRIELWRSLAQADFKCALLAAMVQHRATNATSGVQEPNRRVLPPFDVCVKILADTAASDSHELIHGILQNGEYTLNTSQREELEKQFTDAITNGTLSPFAALTMERLNFRYPR